MAFLISFGPECRASAGLHQLSAAAAGGAERPACRVGRGRSASRARSDRVDSCGDGALRCGVSGRQRQAAEGSRPQGHGADHGRRGPGQPLKKEAAIEAAQKSDAIIYSIYYVDQSAYYGHGFGVGGGGDGALRHMSEETGGRLLKVDRKHTLNDIFNQIQEEMRSQYSIGFSSTNPRKRRRIPAAGNQDPRQEPKSPGPQRLLRRKITVAHALVRATSPLMATLGRCPQSQSIFRIAR